MTSSADAMDRFHAIIPAGGVGSRLWPLSRQDAPKFLHDLTGSGKSLLRDTWDRLLPLTGPGRIMVVTGRAHRAAVEEHLPALEDHNIVLEADPRDSTVAICLAAAILERREPGVIVGSFAADHLIGRLDLFEKAIREAVQVADAGFIATVGIKPTEPAVGFGYIREGARLHIEGAPSARAVDSFVEKPDLDTAKEYVRSGRFLWNASMFISRADLLLAELERNRPQLLEQIQELAAAWDDPARRGPAVDRIWPKLEKVAIDYAIAEPAAGDGRMAVVPGLFDWDDVGDFASLAKVNSGGRKTDLAILGEHARVLSDAASGIVVSQSNRVISLIGVKDIVVVDTPDALLVTTTEHAQRVKAVVDALKLTGSSNVL
ncbi:mannose-1-phosphate guanylyltransferase [Gryllotalpicola ginsengisoli]|uniref:mannose-1-phosphate guanylyltransferase n=1 Tax=Gryllotalpicola ginsengisoli TaxID=444608 RepID=UPI0003B5AA53|nr:mannose-1-phosphate guanylyltransferase [Gryllotalpicola ginsengisoli]